ncbi:hypothetical protein TUZN_1776 [Thermoproteus uzoniensis 768-20]|uniref:DUF973 family protein n=1 Tax=Thermoproteus uzoniensis (strain 768-20) TaxID=999630 RepID=F2L3J8_THEU7|nr:hypothetical protein [Thermoproteus uzoniensis]AEA13237.1 hypothetical protein TUZN_1776 [Thermoproteus uzoniensis 768-20]
MNFQEANKSLYRGYLYTLILSIIAGVAVLVELSSVIFSHLAPYWGSYVVPPSSPTPQESEFILTLISAIFTTIIISSISYLVIFFLFIFRGYMALHRLGIKWAEWLAWGPVILTIIGLALLGVIFWVLLNLPHWSSGSAPYPGVSMWGVVTAILAPLIALAAFGLFIDIVHILFLDNMYKYTQISKFHTAFILFIIALVLSFIPYVNIIGGILAFVEYIIEMLAYKEASEWAPPGQPQTPPGVSPASR